MTRDRFPAHTCWIIPKEGDGADPNAPTRVEGTNICIFKPEETLWYMARIDSTHRRPATFTANADGDAIVMTGHNAQGRLVRNTFSDITDDSFEWTQEWTGDAGETWFAVSKTHCDGRE